MADDTPAGDLDEAERYVRRAVTSGLHRTPPEFLARVMEEYDRRAYERDTALARVAAAEAVQTRMADSLPDHGPWQAWSERDRAVRAYEGDLSTALANETDLEAAEPAHRYLSTSCLHGRHDYCTSMTGMQGEKRPARCKFCDARCVCPCHHEEDTRRP